jgi:hypothetical protein
VNYVFLADRLNYLKFFGPLVNRLAQEGSGRVQVIGLSEGTGFKAAHGREIYRLNELVPENCTVQILKSRQDIAMLLSTLGNVVVFSLHAKPAYAVEDSKNLIWITLQHYADNRADGARMFDCDLFCAYSPAWFLEKPSEDNVAYLGFPQFDALRTVDKESLRRKYGLDRFSGVVTYLCFDHPYSYGFASRWRRAVMRNVVLEDLQGAIPRIARFLFGHAFLQEREFISALAGWCKRRDLALILKSRTKRPVPEVLASLASGVFYDDQYCPSTMMELFLISKLVVSSVSIGHCEGVFAGARAVAMYPKAMRDEFFRFPDEVFGRDWKKFFSRPGLCELKSMEQLYQDLVSDSDDLCSPIDSAQRDQYVREYFGFDDFGSTERILEHVRQIQKKRFNIRGDQ